MHYALRPATPDDYEWVRRLHHTVLRAAVEDMWGWDEAFQDDFFARFFQPSKVQVIRVEGRDAGILSVERRDEHILLSNIWLAPDFQGKGVGTRVVVDLQAQAGAAHLPLVLEVLRTNRARELYERLGFGVYEETATRFRI
jgi:ribosomal protein S18 acetylase RimI-like enzyme